MNEKAFRVRAELAVETLIHIKEAVNNAHRAGSLTDDERDIDRAVHIYCAELVGDCLQNGVME